MRAGLLADKYSSDFYHSTVGVGSPEFVRDEIRKAFIRGYKAAQSDASRAVRNTQCGHACACLDYAVGTIEAL